MPQIAAVFGYLRLRDHAVEVGVRQEQLALRPARGEKLDDIPHQRDVRAVIKAVAVDVLGVGKPLVQEVRVGGGDEPVLVYIHLLHPHVPSGVGAGGRRLRRLVAYDLRYLFLAFFTRVVCLRGYDVGGAYEILHERQRAVGGVMVLYGLPYGHPVHLVGPAVIPLFAPLVPRIEHVLVPEAEVPRRVIVLVLGPEKRRPPAGAGRSHLHLPARRGVYRIEIFGHAEVPAVVLLVHGLVPVLQSARTRVFDYLLGIAQLVHVRDLCEDVITDRVRGIIVGRQHFRGVRVHPVHGRDPFFPLQPRVGRSDRIPCGVRRIDIGKREVRIVGIHALVVVFAGRGVLRYVVHELLALVSGVCLVRAAVVAHGEGIGQLVGRGIVIVCLHARGVDLAHYRRPVLYGLHELLALFALVFRIAYERVMVPAHVDPGGRRGQLVLGAVGIGRYAVHRGPVALVIRPLDELFPVGEARIDKVRQLPTVGPHRLARVLYVGFVAVGKRVIGRIGIRRYRRERRAVALVALHLIRLLVVPASYIIRYAPQLRRVGPVLGDHLPKVGIACRRTVFVLVDAVYVRPVHPVYVHLVYLPGIGQGPCREVFLVVSHALQAPDGGPLAHLCLLDDVAAYRVAGDGSVIRVEDVIAVLVHPVVYDPQRVPHGCCER